MIATSQISLVLLNRIFKQSNLIGNVFNDIIFDFYSLPQLSILFLKLLNLSCMLVLILYFYWSDLFFGKYLLLFTVWKRFLSEMLSLWHDISWNWGFWAWLILYWRLWSILMFWSTWELIWGAVMGFTGGIGGGAIGVSGPVGIMWGSWRGVWFALSTGAMTIGSEMVSFCEFMTRGSENNVLRNKCHIIGGIKRQKF